MCSTIRPLSGAYYFSFQHERHCWKAPTQWLSPDLYFTPFGHTDTKISECGQLSAPCQGPTVSVYGKKRDFRKTLTRGSHQKCFLGHLVTTT